jgi:beta-lactamase class A
LSPRSKREAPTPLTVAVLDGLDAAELRERAAAVVIDLRTGATSAWRPDEDIYPASIVKLALMAEAFRRFDDGSLSPDAHEVIARRNLTLTAEPTPLIEGYRARVAELVALMIERSDNIATNQLIDLLERKRVEDSMRALGLEHFRLGRKLSGSEPLVDDPESGERNSMPPADAAKLLGLIAIGAVSGAAQQRELLARCVDRTKLVDGLLPGDRFMHKTGETSAVAHDAGILRTANGHEYVIVLYTTGHRSVLGGPDAAMAAWMRSVRARL